MAKTGILAGTALAVLLAGAALAQSSGELAYTPDGKMVFPKDYRDWVYLLRYGHVLCRGAVGPHMFRQCFVDPAAYDDVLKNGIWPDKTVTMQENRAAGDERL